MSAGCVSVRRWAATTAVMCAVAWALWALGCGVSELRAAAGDPQGLVDRAGADALVLVVVTALAWSCWAWGAVGLLLTAASTAPGAPGRLAGVLLGGLVPAGARRTAALALGIGLSAASPAVLLPVPAPVAVVSAAVDTPLAVDRPGGPADQVSPDWPGAPAPADRTPPPDIDWPAPAPGEHVVVRGNCLWDIAAAWLQSQRADVPVTDAAVQRAVQRWWQANAAVIGPDPDLLLPGQVLRPPD
jgi:hypothetical protein